jgi:hypothetical protein
MCGVHDDPPDWCGATRREIGDRLGQDSCKEKSGAIEELQASRDRFETVNAQTRRKTSQHPGPEDKASQ